MVLWQGIDYGLISVAMHFKVLLESYIQAGRNVDSRASEINLRTYCMSPRNKVAVSLFLSLGSWTERMTLDDTRINKKWPQREAQKHCDDIHEAYEIPFSNLPNVGGSQNPIKVALQKTNLIRLFLWLSIWSWCALFLPIESGPLSKYGL